MPSGPASPATMPTRRKISSNGPPKRKATTLDRMPASTSSAPKKVSKLIESSDAIESRSSLVDCAKYRDATDLYQSFTILHERGLNLSVSQGKSGSVARGRRDYCRV